MDTVPISLVFQLMLGTTRKRHQASFRLSRLGLSPSVCTRCKMKGRRARTELDTMMPRLQSLTPSLIYDAAPADETDRIRCGGEDSFAALPGDWRELHDVRELLEGTNYAYGLTGSARVGILRYRQSLPVDSRVIPFPKFAQIYRGMRTARKGLGGISRYVGAPIATLMDYHAMQQDQISPERFAFRTTGTDASVLIAYAVGGPYRAIAGTLLTFVFYGSEAGYDLTSELASELIKGIADLKQALRSGWQLRY